MQFLALLTLNILLLTNFIRSTNRLTQNASQTHIDQGTSQSKFNPDNQESVLGSYVTTFDAINQNTSPSRKNEIPPEEIQTSQNTTQTEKIETPTTTTLLTPTPKISDPKTTKSAILEASDNATGLFNQINTYRQENGLPSFSYNQIVCDFAITRAQELINDFSHRGFRTRIDSGTLPYSDYSHVAENIADTDTPKRAFELWHNSPGHNENMLSGASYGCIGNIGRLYTLELWEP